MEKRSASSSWPIQQSRERIDAYIERLEKIIGGCAITDADQIKDLLVSTITINCASKSVQRFILSKEDPTVAEIVKEAKIHESIEREQKQILEIKVNHVSTDSDIRAVQTSGDKCKDCGKSSHKTDSACSAIGRQCHQCQERGHYAAMCTNKNSRPRLDNQVQKRDNNHRGGYRGHRHHQQSHQSQQQFQSQTGYNNHRPRNNVNQIQECGCCQQSYDEVNTINHQQVYQQQQQQWNQHQMGPGYDSVQGACGGGRPLTSQPGQH